MEKRGAPFEFGEWRVDPRLNQISRGNAEPAVRLRPQLVDLLMFLAVNSGRVVSKQQILDAVWPDQSVSESALTACISELRQALGDTGRASAVIENIPKRGYRLLPPVRWTDDTPPAVPPIESIEPVRVDGAAKAAAAAIAGGPSVSRPRRAIGVALLIATAVIGIALAGWQTVDSNRSPSHRDRPYSLAVLPLKNLTGDSQQDYFVDGLTEQIRSELARAKSFGVISGMSAQRYKQGSASAREIAKELGQVDGLLEGSVTRAGNRVRIMLDLVDASADTQVWARTFDVQLGDILNLYSDITRLVAAEVETTVAPDSAAQPVPRRNVKPESYDKFLQARYFSHRWQAGGCEKAEPLLQEAINLDPSFAAAYTELAFCNTFPDMLRRPTTEVAAAAHKAIEQALKLDDSSAFAHTVHGLIQLGQDFDWVAAEGSYKRAIELDRSEPYANFLYGELLYSSGRSDQALALLREGLRHEPLSMDMKSAYGMALRAVGQSTTATKYLEGVLENTPDWPTGRFWLSAAYADVDRRKEAVSEYLSFLRQVLPAERAQTVTARLESTFVQSGWLAFLKEDVNLAGDPRGTFLVSIIAPYDRYWSPFWMAWRYARLGDRDRALKLLTIAYDGRDHHLQYINVEPAFKGLRSDRRFQDLVHRIGLSTFVTTALRQRPAG